MESKIVHFFYCPFSGLGLYNGFRGNRWLRNRIKIFKQFVIPSLQAQTNKNFILWCSWRREEKNNPYVKEFIIFLNELNLKSVHTFHGICFWDDKYPDDIARDRLLTSLHGSIGELFDVIGDVDYVLMTIQPSDDCYSINAVQGIQAVFEKIPNLQAFGFQKGYIMNYLTREVAEYNPNTTPPFFTIKFPKAIFIEPLKHAEYTGPYKSHEYVADKLKFGSVQEREFMVGTHLENISTYFDHPFKGVAVDKEILKKFGLYDVPPLKLSFSLRKWVLRKLPHKVRRKLRYIFGERFYAKFYDFIRA